MSVDLSIIIVNWKAVGHLRKCLASILAHVHLPNVEVIVIDNASNDGCAGVLAAEFPWVTCVCSDVNLGFAAANNVGFSVSTGRHVLFLNPDTEIVDNAVGELMRVLDCIPDAGIAGGKLLNSDLTV